MKAGKKKNETIVPFAVCQEPLIIPANIAIKGR
jgi:hypothetical protein